MKPGSQNAPHGQYMVRVPSQHVAAEGLANLFEASPDPTPLKLGNPAIWTPRQDITRLLARHEIFKHVLDIPGSIVECGVGHGGGILAWLHFTAIHEPVNHQRTIIGFDTFQGFPELSPQDILDTEAVGNNTDSRTGGLAVDSADQIMACVEYHNANRPLGQLTKIELVKGDARQTIPQYLQANPHLVVSLLYLDFDLYAPTKTALEHLLPRMPKGAVIAFDELNIPAWPGETLAALEHIPNLELRRLTWGPTTCWAVL